MAHVLRWLSALPLLLLGTLAFAIEPDPPGQVATLPPVGAHWVWVPDRLL